MNSFSSGNISSHDSLPATKYGTLLSMSNRQAGRHSKNVGTRYIPTGKGGKRDAKRLRVWAEKNWRKALKNEDA